MIADDISSKTDEITDSVKVDPNEDDESEESTEMNQSEEEEEEIEGEGEGSMEGEHVEKLEMKKTITREPVLTPAELLIRQIQAQVKQLDNGEKEGDDSTRSPERKELFSPYTPPFRNVISPSDRVLTPGPQVPVDDASQHNPTTYLLKSLTDKVKDVERIEREANSLEQSMGFHEDVNLEDSLDEMAEDDLDPELMKRFSSLKKARKKIHKEVRKLDDISVGVSKSEVNIHRHPQSTNISSRDQSRSQDTILMMSQRESILLDKERERIRDVATSFEMYLDVMKENLRMERKIMSQDREKGVLNDRLQKLNEKHLKMQYKHEKEVGNFLLERNRWLNIHNNVLMMLLLLFSFAIIFFLIFP